MSTLILLYLLAIPVFGFEHSARCSNESNKLTFEPAEDGVDGRYKVEWCTNVEHYNQVWVLNLNYIEHYPPEKCKKFTLKIPVTQRHSYSEFRITNKCSNTLCLTTYQDLIFNGTCFSIQTTLKNMSSGHERSNPGDNGLFYIENKFPKEKFTNSTTSVTYEQLNDKNLFVVLTGFIPVTDYHIVLCLNKKELKNCDTVSDDCTIDNTISYQINCLLDKHAGCYQLIFQHRAPWTGADIFKTQLSHRYNVCLSDANNGSTIDVNYQNDTSVAILWGGAAVVLGLTVLALVVLFTFRTAHGKKLHQQVLQNWLKRSETVTPHKAVPVGTRVLLIYARDCPPFTRAVQILVTALRRTGCQVIDIFSTEAAVQSARAPNEWLRRLATDPATRLLLLQSPAGLAFYCPQLTHQASPTLSAPLLGRAAVRRAPHAADNMAMMALRLLGEAAIHPHAYRKCYVATIKGLDCEMVPGVTPLRRYELPAYADVLLRDLTPGADNDLLTDDSQNTTTGSDTTDLLQNLTDALNEMCEFVHDNPNYLTDELLFI